MASFLRNRGSSARIARQSLVIPIEITSTNTGHKALRRGREARGNRSTSHGNNACGCWPKNRSAAVVPAIGDPIRIAWQRADSENGLEPESFPKVQRAACVRPLARTDQPHQRCSTQQPVRSAKTVKFQATDSDALFTLAGIDRFTCIGQLRLCLETPVEVIVDKQNSIGVSSWTFTNTNPLKTSSLAIPPARLVIDADHNFGIGQMR